MKNERGFTLLELLVVVAIIGILATLALSNFITFKINAKNAMAASDARNAAPAADFVSTSVSAPTFYSWTQDGGPIPGLEPARSSPGTFGTAIVGPNSYIVTVGHIEGSRCYTIDNGVTTDSPCP